MQQKLIYQIRDRLRPYGGFLIPDGPDGVIATKRGGRIYLTETAEGLRTEIIRSDGKTINDTRPLDEPSRLTIAIRALTFRAKA